MPVPTGTGFFVSPDGWFVTAAHVITENNAPDGNVRSDIAKGWLMKETRLSDGVPGAMCQSVAVGHVLPRLDFALLKVDFRANSDKAWLSGKSAFPSLRVSRHELQEGESVYSFGYPLSTAVSRTVGQFVVGSASLCPRVTSAIISSTLDETRMMMSDGDIRRYVLDKVLNYGNSGGPVIATMTGHVHAFCSKFQPVYVPQSHLLDKSGNPMHVMIPSLYGIVTSLANQEIVSLLQNVGVAIGDDGI